MLDPTATAMVPVVAIGQNAVSHQAGAVEHDEITPVTIPRIVKTQT